MPKTIKERFAKPSTAPPPASERYAGRAALPNWRATADKLRAEAAAASKVYEIVAAEAKPGDVEGWALAMLATSVNATLGALASAIEVGLVEQSEPGGVRDETASKVLSVRLPAAQHRSIVAEASRRDVTPSQIVRELLPQYLSPKS
jgi:hypothetical protein